MNMEKNKILNKHLFTSVFVFAAVIIVILTFTSFLEEAKKNDIYLNKKEIKK